MGPGDFHANLNMNMDGHPNLNMGLQTVDLAEFDGSFRLPALDTVDTDPCIGILDENNMMNLNLNQEVILELSEFLSTQSEVKLEYPNFDTSHSEVIVEPSDSISSSTEVKQEYPNSPDSAAYSKCWSPGQLIQEECSVSGRLSRMSQVSTVTMPTQLQEPGQKKKRGAPRMIYPPGEELKEKKAKQGQDYRLKKKEAMQKLDNELEALREEVRIKEGLVHEMKYLNSESMRIYTSMVEDFGFVC